MWVIKSDDAEAKEDCENLVRPAEVADITRSEWDNFSITAILGPISWRLTGLIYKRMLEHALAEYDEYEWMIPAALASELIDIQLPGTGQLWIDDRFSRHGVLPYFFPQHYRRLVKAFEAKNIPAIVRLSADIGHYIGDAHVPLHTTKNYNGQLTGQEGIHAFWESRIPELFAEEEFDFLVGRSSYIRSPEDFIWEVVGASHRGVDSVLSIEKSLSQSLPPDLQYCYETRLGVVTKLPCRDYARLYHERLDRQVEARFRAGTLAIGIRVSCYHHCSRAGLQPGSALMMPDPASLLRIRTSSGTLPGPTPDSPT